MSTSGRARTGTGPFRPEQLQSGDPYELSNGHAIYCAPTGGDGTGPNLRGGFVLDSDPMVKCAGVDTGFQLNPLTMRAPDVAVGDFAERPGWVKGAPPLAIEYAAGGQDEDELREKVDDLLRAGTRYLWVVRLTGPRRVEVYEPNKPMRVVASGQALTAPGVLQNDVPVEALYDREVAHEVALRNLLQRKGYDSLEAVQREGERAGRVEGERAGRVEGERAGRVEGERAGKLDAEAKALLRVLDRRGVTLDEATRARVLACVDTETLDAWLDRAATASTAADVFGDG